MKKNEPPRHKWQSFFKELKGSLLRSPLFSAKEKRKAMLLFEVTIVVFIVSLAALFLFRGYNSFVKAGKKSVNYFKLISLLEEKIWDLELKEAKEELAMDADKEGSFDSGQSWQLKLEEVSLGNTKVENLLKGILSIKDKKSKQDLDALIYLKTKKP